MAESGGRVEVINRGGLRIVTLSSVERRNAISAAMRLQLVQALDEAIADRQCRAIILTGAGGHFCSGGDLRDAIVGDHEPERIARNVYALQEVIKRIVSEKPVIAAVEGSAFGAGLGLAASCDFVFASRTARFSASFARVGLSGDAGITWTLPRRVGALRGFQMLMSAHVLDAEEGLQAGLVDHLVDEGQALAAAIAQAGLIAAMAPLSLKAIKAMMRRPAQSLDDALQIELQHQLMLTASDDYAEGKRAFIERRAPVFNGE